MKEKISSHVTWDLSRLQNQPTRLNSLKKCEAYGTIKGHKGILSGISGSLKTLAKLFKSILRIEKYLDWNCVLLSNFRYHFNTCGSVTKLHTQMPILKLRQFAVCHLSTCC